MNSILLTSAGRFSVAADLAMSAVPGSCLNRCQCRIQRLWGNSWASQGGPERFLECIPDLPARQGEQGGMNQWHGVGTGPWVTSRARTCEICLKILSVSPSFQGFALECSWVLLGGMLFRKGNSRRASKWPCLSLWFLETHPKCRVLGYKSL